MMMELVVTSIWRPIWTDRGVIQNDNQPCMGGYGLNEDVDHLFVKFGFLTEFAHCFYICSNLLP